MQSCNGARHDPYYGKEGKQTTGVLKFIKTKKCKKGRPHHWNNIFETIYQNEWGLRTVKIFNLNIDQEKENWVKGKIYQIDIIAKKHDPWKNPNTNKIEYSTNVTEYHCYGEKVVL